MSGSTWISETLRLPNPNASRSREVQAVDACRGQSVASAPNSSVELAPPAQVGAWKPG